jgi:homoserine/homoserine lactone efflux protein
MTAQTMGAFVATCFLVSLTPGLCSMLCLSLATSLGLRRTQWMMLGEVIGMGSVGTAAVLGIATVLTLSPALLQFMKVAGSGYLIYLGWRIMQRSPVDATRASGSARSPFSLAALGFATAVTNPKVWALYVALLPPFVDATRPLGPQLGLMLAILVAVELLALYAYALGGRAIVGVRDSPFSRSLVSRVSGALMAAMGAWMLIP